MDVILRSLVLAAAMVAYLTTAVVGDESDGRLVLVVTGASGTDEYERAFNTWADRWIDAAQSGGTNVVRIGVGDRSADSTDHGVLRSQIESFEESHLDHAGAELWIVLIGHGTFDGRLARFNLRGPDVSASELERWLENIKCPTVIANCASASAPFMQRLAAPHRVVITATKSGAEHNFARFGDHLSRAIGDASFDLDKDGQTSLFEAYLAASRRTDQFYESEGRLATEHSLLDDNGDGQGIRADWFRGIRPVKTPKGTEKVDGRRAHQLHLVRSETEQSLPAELRQQRDDLELAVIELRDRKAQFASEDEYYAQLEPLLVRLAQVYQRPATARN